MHDRNQSVEDLKQISAILLREWDPIGVADTPEAHAEYDSYAEDILALLLKPEATVGLIAAHLLRIAGDEMSLPSAPTLANRCGKAAMQLMKIAERGMLSKTSGRGPNVEKNHGRIRRFIAANLPVLPVPGIPEIRLHKANPQSGLRRLAERDPHFGSPYWAHHWGGGLALARYLLDRPETVTGLRMLDLGAGSGIVSIAAAKAGATDVYAADIDPYAIKAIELNAAVNSVSVHPIFADLTQGPPPDVDVLCIGDLFYEATLAKSVTVFLDRCLEQGIAVLIGDPWRAHLPTSRLRLLTEYAVPDFGEDTKSARLSGVFAFENASHQ